MVCHLIFHLLPRINQPVLACDGDDLFAGHLGEVTTAHAECTLYSVKQPVFLARQPDDVLHSIVQRDTVEVVTLKVAALLVHRLRTNPRKCYGVRKEDVPEVAHLVVTLFAMTVESVNRRGVHDGHLFAIDPLMRTRLFVENTDVRVRFALRRSVQRSIAGSFYRQDKMHLCAIG